MCIFFVRGGALIAQLQPPPIYLYLVLILILMPSLQSQRTLAVLQEYIAIKTLTVSLKIIIEGFKNT